MKKLICIALALVLCLGVTAFAEEATNTDILVEEKASEPAPIKLIADNKLIETPTHIVKSRTLVPVRALMESTNATVDWDNDTKTVTIKRNDKTVTLQIDNKVMKTDDGEVKLDAAPILLENGTTTYVPLRAICEAFGFTVDWDSTGSNTILVLSPDGCRYVDTYEGATLEEYLANLGASPEEFSEITGIDYEANKDKLYALVDNSISIGKMAEMNGYELNDMLTAFGAEGTDPATPWGEFMGNLTMEQYILNFTPALQYGIDTASALESIKASYGLGDEYTLETPYKYVSVIIETLNYEYHKIVEAQQKAEEEQKAKDLEALPALLENKIYFTITLEDKSVMQGELYPDLAPQTVANFVKLCNENFYEGLIFHRVIDGFMIQGGGFDKDFNPKDAQAITGEFYSNGFANALKHEKGVLSMARTNDPNSASSQFFIMDEAAPHLDGEYAAFGKITEGLDVAEKISQVETTTNEAGHSDVPVKPIVIKSIKIAK